MNREEPRERRILGAGVPLGPDSVCGGASHVVMTKFIRNRNPKQKEVSATVQVEPQDYQGRSSESTYRIVNWKLPGVQPKWFDTSKRHREGLQVTYISVRWAAKMAALPGATGGPVITFHPQTL